ncbi:hypothetical protein MHUMG1_08805 [Metarhizium humberi]|uniref:Zn(2)-C6 fungal-type domain-containing protein n=1 Tax=Metarhizium humberi TaxID=2596975 RepID=A0A9P8M5U4_9HYPO|nr:hypothetical protein MHUMG1_08805 [Metarhizium humberi]
MDVINVRPPSRAPEADRPRKRRLRKGTRSCWECKRRKVRCIPCSEEGDACLGCKRRGAHCVSQDGPVPDEFPRPADKHAEMAERMERVEGLLGRLVQNVPVLRRSPAAAHSSLDMAGSTACSSLQVTPPVRLASRASCAHRGVRATHSSEPAFQTTDCHPPTPVPDASYTPKLGQISALLYAALPSAQDCRIVCQHRKGFAVFLHQMLIRPYSELTREDYELAANLATLPAPSAHPVLLARHMLMLAASLQHVHSDFQDPACGLSESPSAMMERLFNTASSLVTANDHLMLSVEGIECLLLEGSFEANSGNLRRAWLTFRRAVAFSQLIGLNANAQTPTTLDPATKAMPQFIWFRIISMDRYLCLMLGLPQGSPDDSFASESALASDTPMGRLERMHCVIASRILDRNQRGLTTSHDLTTTREIDLDIQRLAESMPPRWWLPPNLANLAGCECRDVFSETLRLINQLLHYGLLNQLHLPYMLRASLDPKYVYNRVTLVTSSREMLTRFITLRSSNLLALCCQSIDFFTLTAAMTLILAHINANQHAGQSFIAHQRSSDLAMVEQVIDIMQRVTELNTDPLPHKAAHLLAQLLAVEGHAAEGCTYSTQSVDAAESVSPSRLGLTEGSLGTEAPHACFSNDSSVLYIHIPHFGTIKIAREGRISREPAISDWPQISTDRDDERQPQRSSPITEAPSNSNSARILGSADGSALAPLVHNTVAMAPNTTDPQPTQRHQFHSSFTGTAHTLMQEQHAGQSNMALDTNNWVLQGVNVFFDSLLQGADGGDADIR